MSPASRPEPPVPAPAASVSTAVFTGEVVLYDERTCRPLLLNVSAASVWLLLDGRRTLADVVAAVAADFGVELTAVADDVAATIAEFVSLGLLATASP